MSIYESGFIQFNQIKPNLTISMGEKTTENIQWIISCFKEVESLKNLLTINGPTDDWFQPLMCDLDNGP